jgi:hypothetical protein
MLGCLLFVYSDRSFYNVVIVGSSVVSNTEAEVSHVVGFPAVVEVEVSEEQLKIDKQSIYKLVALVV